MFQILFEKKKKDWNSYLQITIISAHTFVCDRTEISAGMKLPTILKYSYRTGHRHNNAI